MLAGFSPLLWPPVNRICPKRLAKKKAQARRLGLNPPKEEGGGDKLGVTVFRIPGPALRFLPRAALAEISEHAHYGIDTTSLFCAMQEIVVNFRFVLVLMPHHQ